MYSWVSLSLVANLIDVGLCFFELDEDFNLCTLSTFPRSRIELKLPQDLIRGLLVGQLVCVQACCSCQLS